MGGTTHWRRGRGEECEESCPEEDEAAETVCDEPGLIAHPPVLLEGGGRENENEVKPQKNGGVGKGVL